MTQYLLYNHDFALFQSSHLVVYVPYDFSLATYHLCSPAYIKGWDSGRERIPGYHFCYYSASGIKTVLHLHAAPQVFFSLPRSSVNFSSLGHLQYTWIGHYYFSGNFSHSNLRSSSCSQEYWIKLVSFHFYCSFTIFAKSGISMYGFLAVDSCRVENSTVDGPFKINLAEMQGCHFSKIG